jgi:hypothetical protein
VVAQIIVDGRVQLFVAPVTHTVPDHAADAVELPASVKKNLGLDKDRSWIMTTELNRFIWPGPDIRMAPGNPGSSPLYGAIPEWLLERVKASVLEKTKARKLGVMPRTE